jgi:hypothetical protein
MKPLGSSGYRGYPAKEEEVVPAKLTTVRPKNGVDGLLEGVPDAYASKINRSAMGTTGREHTLQ